MALDVAEFLWNKFQKSLTELQLESKSGIAIISPFNSSIMKDIISQFKSIKDFVGERDMMPQPDTYSESIDRFYELNDVLAECRVIVHECKQIKNKLSRLNPRPLYSLTTIKAKLTKIEAELHKLPSSQQEDKVQNLQLSTQQTVIQKFPSSQVLGFDKEAKVIEDLLLGGSSSRITEIGVVGIAGVGKTTLVQKVLESKKVKNQFGRILWLPFSGIKEGEQQYSRFNFETCILNEFGETLEPRMIGLDSLLKRLLQLLSVESYLIVLDDVSFQLINIMGRLVSELPKASGGAVIVTSRLKEVAQKLGEHHHFVPVSPLSSEVCSIIFEKTIENEGKLSSIPDESLISKETMKGLKDQCHGLPLFAKALAQTFLKL